MSFFCSEVMSRLDRSQTATDHRIDENEISTRKLEAKLREFSAILVLHFHPRKKYFFRESVFSLSPWRYFPFEFSDQTDAHWNGGSHYKIFSAFGFFFFFWKWRQTKHCDVRATRATTIMRATLNLRNLGIKLWWCRQDDLFLSISWIILV